MQLCLLHLDDALVRQPDFLASCASRTARQLYAVEEGEHIRLWGKNNRLEPVATSIRNSFFAGNDDHPRLCFMGSGDFHHVTALLLAETLKKQKEPVTVVHFDNHPDWVHFKGGMHCGSWVNRAAENEQVVKVITVGVCSNDLQNPDSKGANLNLLFGGKLELFPYDHAPSRVPASYGAGHEIRWDTIRHIGEAAFTEKLLSRILTEKVYITVDKDVLAREDCESNWDQGVMRLPYLLSLLRAIGLKHKIIGADVTGDYSRPKYAGTVWTRALKRGEILLDQPLSGPSEERASQLNSKTNHALLQTFAEVMS